MEKKHKNRLLSEFSRMLDYKLIHVLDIPDEYQFMDEELITELKAKVGAILNNL